MDLSALIFVALAVAWAVYLVPKALKHHDEVVRSRSVDKFSHTMRVLARREPVDGRNARLVVSPARAAQRPPVETKARTTPVVPTDVRTPSPVALRAAARRAARRRRNVLAVITLANLVVIGLAVASVVSWPWVAVPLTLLVAWLVACRVSVKSERRDRVVVTPEPRGLIDAEPAAPATPEADEAIEVAPADVADSDAAELPAVLSGEIPIVRESLPGSWDMVPTPLPTYVSKSAAQQRSVATIDLDSTGVWSSGRNEGDSALAREAEQADRADRAARDEGERKRVSGA